jgi:hypothetical protein
MAQLAEVFPLKGKGSGFESQCRYLYKITNGVIKMQEEVKKSFKGKTLRFYGHIEDADWVGHIYCPWCPVRKDVAANASLKRAAKKAFASIENHWNMEHKE